MFKKTLYIFLTVLFLSGCTNKEQTKPSKKEDPKDVIENYSFSMITAGDALIHNGVYIDANTYKMGNDGQYIYDFTKMFGHIKEVIEPYDLKFYNQETIIGGKKIGLTSYPNFNSPEEIGSDLTNNIGFNVVNLASNHTMDRGEAAVLNSLEFWKQQKNVQTLGSYSSFEERNKIDIREINGISYAFLSYTYGTNGMPVPKGKEYYVNLWDQLKDEEYEAYKKTVKEDIDRIRDKVDVLMVSMHWGVEYVHVPTATQRDAAQFLADNGVDVIIGHHSHSVMPVEWIDDTLVIYSLGNMISAQDTTQKKVGLMAAFTINKEVVNGKTTKVEVTDAKADLIYTYSNYYKNFNIVPFSRLTDNQLYNHRSIYEQYKKYINPKNDPKVQVGFIE